MTEQEEKIIDRVSLGLTTVGFVAASAQFFAPNHIPEFVFNAGIDANIAGLWIGLSTKERFRDSKLEKFATNFVAQPIQKWIAHTAQFDRDIS